MKENKNRKTGNRMKRFAKRFSVMFLFLAVTGLAAGCSRYGGGNSATKDGGETGNHAAGEPKKEGKGTDGKLNVVTTLFPYYDFLRQIAGDDIELTLVVPAGMDSHSFEPTPADMITIQNADLVVCNGGAMEQWLEKVLDSFGDGAAPGRVVTMMDYVDTVEEEIVEGMEAEEHDHSSDRHIHGNDGHLHEEDEHLHEEDEHLHEGDEHLHEEDGHLHEADEHTHEGEQFHAHTHEEEHGYGEDLLHSGHEHDDGHEIEIEYDEHIWTSPVNAMKLTGVLADVLMEEDPAHAAGYRRRADDYIGKLKTLDQEFRDVVAAGRRRLLVFGDKFPLRYFFDEYGLEYRAAFTGCSTDTEPSAKTIAYLIDKVKAENIPVVYYLELSSHRVAEIIGEETGAEPLLFHSCHNVTRRQFDSGVTYLELMEQNVVNLRKGLE